MNDAQTWTAIIGTLAVQATTLTVVLTFQGRWIKARIDSLADRLDRIDRDVHAVVVRMMGGESA